MNVTSTPGGVTVKGDEVLRELAACLEGTLADDLAALAHNPRVAAVELAVPTPRIALDEPEPSDDYKWLTQAFVPEGPGDPDDPNDLNLAQRFFDFGLIWLANRTLHPFGYAIGVSVNNVEEKKVTGFNLHNSTDAQGITFGDDLEMAGRQKFYKALRREFAGNLGW